MERFSNLGVGVGVGNSMNVELQSIQDDELRIVDNGESSAYDSWESTGREIGFEMKIIAAWNCELGEMGLAFELLW